MIDEDRADHGRRIMHQTCVCRRPQRGRFPTCSVRPRTRVARGDGKPPFNSIAYPHGDVGDPHTVARAFAEPQSSYEQLDVLLNNGGTAAAELADEIKNSAWNRVVSTNLSGTFFCAREAFRLMRSQDPIGSRIINNGSVSALAPRPRSIVYIVTKHAITGLTTNLALDGRPSASRAGKSTLVTRTSPYGRGSRGSCAGRRLCSAGTGDAAPGCGPLRTTDDEAVPWFQRSTQHGHGDERL